MVCDTTRLECQWDSFLNVSVWQAVLFVYMSCWTTTGNTPLFLWRIFFLFKLYKKVVFCWREQTKTRVRCEIDEEWWTFNIKIVKFCMTLCYLYYWSIGSFKHRNSYNTQHKFLFKSDFCENVENLSNKRDALPFSCFMQIANECNHRCYYISSLIVYYCFSCFTRVVTSSR